MQLSNVAISRVAASFRVAVVCAALVGVMIIAAGCLGPTAVSQTRTRYNEVYRSTNDEQILLNIVRLRYADSPVFVDLPNITSQFEFEANGNYLGGHGNQFPGVTSLGLGNLQVRDSPTLSFHPRGGQEIAKALLTPLSAELFSVVNAGANVEQFMLMAINDINDLPNAAGSIVMTPAVPSDNYEFRRGVQMLAELDQRGAVELVVKKMEDDDQSDPIPSQQVQGRDLVSAQKDDFYFRETEDGRMTVRKQEKMLILRIRLEDIDSPEVHEMCRIFRLKPGQNVYKVKSELSGDHPKRLVPDKDELEDTIYVNMRSMLQMGIFLSKGVCVPDEHILDGVAPMTPGPDGQYYDWTQVTQGIFRVCVQKRKPRNAEAAVRYRGYWFYIPQNDVQSRAALAIFELLFSVQESEGKPLGPLFTLPIGGG